MVVIFIQLNELSHLTVALICNITGENYTEICKITQTMSYHFLFNLLVLIFRHFSRHTSLKNTRDLKKKVINAPAAKKDSTTSTEW